jgi:hypothetical protein
MGRRTDTDYYLRVTERGGKVEVKALLETAPVLPGSMEAAGIKDDAEGALFRPLARDRKTFLRKHMARQHICALVKLGQNTATIGRIHLPALAGRSAGT